MRMPSTFKRGYCGRDDLHEAPEILRQSLPSLQLAAYAVRPDLPVTSYPLQKTPIPLTSLRLRFRPSPRHVS
jgi:hypothetical protein